MTEALGQPESVQTAHLHLVKPRAKARSWLCYRRGRRKGVGHSSCHLTKEDIHLPGDLAKGRTTQDGAGRTLNLSPECPSCEGLGTDLHRHGDHPPVEAPASHCCAAESHPGKHMESPAVQVGHKEKDFGQAGPAKGEGGN